MTTTTPTVTTAPVTFQGARLVGYTEHPRSSEETIAFDAEVHLDGKRVGILSNAGQGGASTFRADSAEAHKAFREAQDAFPGITNTEYGFTNDLIDTLAEIAGVAKLLRTRGVGFVPDKAPEDLVSDTGNFPAYKLPAKAAQDLDTVLSDLMADTGAMTLLYPVKERGGYWLHTATR